jgi:hypothetical protein
MAIDVDAIINSIKTGVVSLAKTSLANYLPQAEKDAEAIGASLKDNIVTWTTQLSGGQIDGEDLAFLIKGNEQLLKVDALTQAGVALVALDQFKQGIIDLIVNTLTAAIKL